MTDVALFPIERPEVCPDCREVTCDADCPTAAAHGWPTEADKTPTGWTERILLDRLRTRHNVLRGNGPVWAYMEHVKDRAGHFHRATIDALAVHLWPSSGNLVHAYEVKVSRADFRRELADGCAKSEPWTCWVDLFWIVAPAGVVPIEELPPRWGLLETRGPGLAVRRQARALRPAPAPGEPRSDLPRSLVASMLRSAARTASRA
jgi:hypothetical protein